ncbi:flap endonuclease-1 [archaeon]|nr:flap endonuclease-1 [archaeon]
MGVQIADIIPRKEIEFSELKGQTIAVDAMNTLYQFLTTIRQQDGTPLMDKKGEITSHLSGLFYRNINLITEGINPIYVFDGKPSELKAEEIERRKALKLVAEEKYEEAKSSQNIEGMRKYSQQFVKINSKIIEESKEFLEAFGIPVIESDGEGEAEAAHIVSINQAWASASQDYDSLLYGTPRLIRNLTLSRKRKTSAGIYVDTKIEIIDFESLLTHLQINREQLICLGILVGTDFNPGGVKGIGQMKALEIVKKYEYPVKIFEYIRNAEKYELTFDWTEVFREFKRYAQLDTPEIEFKKPDKAKVKEILLRHDFSEERIDSGLRKLDEHEEEKKQKGLTEFF